MKQHISAPLLVVWDDLSAHRSRLVRDYIESLDDRIEVTYLQPYAPELNPVKYIWAYWKQQDLPNVCPKEYCQMSQVALGRHRLEDKLAQSTAKQTKDEIEAENELCKQYKAECLRSHKTENIFKGKKASSP